MFRRASIPWLIAHELRVAWRSIGSGGRKGTPKKGGFWRSPITGVAILLVLGMAIGVPAAMALQGTEIVAAPLLVLILDAVLFLLFTLILSTALVATVDAFYQRGDLDLLLSSPLPPRKTLTVRAVSISITPMLLFGALVTPFVIPAAVLGHPELLGVYPVIFSLALLGTAAALALAMGLFVVIGPRRTRVAAQILAAVMGGLFVIVAQLPNIVGNNEDFWGNFVANLLQGGDLPAIVRWPAEAVLGSLLPLVGIVLVALVIFTLTARWIGNRFATDAASARGVDARSSRRGRTTARFGASVFRSTFAKEARLIARDPALISQILLRVIYVAPLLIFIFGNGEELNELTGALVAASIIFLAGQMAGSIAWITMSAEDSPELLAASPVPLRTFLMAKLTTTLAIPAIIVLPAAVALSFFSPVAGIVGLVAGAIAATVSGLINLWLLKPVKRSEFRRSWSTSFAPSILELLSTAAITGAVVLAFLGLWLWALAPVALAIAVVGFAYRSEAAVRDRLVGAE
ncbi:MAG: hypothetical protein AB7O56_09710 [Bauldia sp.]